MIFKPILVIFAAITAAIIFCPIVYEVMRYAPDSSWAFAINYFVNKNILFGRDVLWTYGPLGFLTEPMNIGFNLAIAILFQISLWFILFSVIIHFILRRYFSITQLGLFFICFFFATQRLIPSSEYFISFLVMFFLSFSFFIKRWYIFYIIALLFSTLSSFVKFSSFSLCISAVLSFIFVIGFSDRKKALKAMALAIIFIPLLFVLSYILYNPSLSDMLIYIKGIYEIFSGYNVAASIKGADSAFIAVLFVFMCYASLIFLFYKTKQASLRVSLILIAPLFIAFKHGFVRQDQEHIIIFFGFSILIFALNLLFTDFTKIIKDIKATRIVQLGTALGILFTMVYPLNHKYFARFFVISNRTFIKEKVNLLSQQYLQDMRLPQDLLSKVGSHSISIFGWDLSYVTPNNLNYRPFPVFQSYAAYTSYLDYLNSKYLEDQNKAPEFILMKWQGIDNRHPLVDVPATWLSMYKWYDIEGQDNQLLLFKRRRVPRFICLELIARKEYRNNDSIEIPISYNPIIMKIYMKPDIAGRFLGVFFRIPEINMELFMAPSSKSSFRIIPDTLRDGVFVNFLPLGLDQVKILIDANESRYMTNRLRLYGNGIRFYSNKMVVEFYKIPDINIVLRGDYNDLLAQIT